MSQRNFQEEGTITPHAHDVLCCKHTTVFLHAGNVHFRNLLYTNHEAYVSAKANRQKQSLIIRKVVEEVKERDPPGRFLRIQATTSLWGEISDKEAAAKTRNAFNWLTDKNRSSRVAAATPQNHGVVGHGSSSERNFHEASFEAPHEHDVLCYTLFGRFNQHEGNIHYRNLLYMNMAAYLSSKNSCQKSQISQEIVKEVKARNPPGRFMRKQAKTGRFWCPISDEKAAAITQGALKRLTDDKNKSPRLSAARLPPKNVGLVCGRKKSSAARTFGTQKLLSGDRIKNPHDHDVLCCGIGGGHYIHHAGNVYLRRLAREHKSAYVESNTKKMKWKIFLLIQKEI